MKVRSKGCFIVSISWIFISLLWFLWVKNTAMGILWLLCGIIELVIALVMCFNEKKGR